jgi:hypothetical protein
MARPTKFSQELADQICQRVATTSFGLVKICEEFEIDYATIKRWLISNPEFCAKYEKAKQDQCDVLADEIMTIADNKDDDYTQGEFGKVGNSTNVARARLQIDARKWIASKLKPKKWGDKVDVDLTSNGEQIKININLPNPNNES